MENAYGTQITTEEHIKKSYCLITRWLLTMKMKNVTAVYAEM